MSSRVARGLAGPFVASTGSSSRILIIDDEYANVALLAAMLGEAGYEHIEGSTDALVAMERFCAFRPDLVILDLHMPGIDGYQLLAQISETMQDDSFVPVMVITADVTNDARDRAFRSGATDFLTKPFDLLDCTLRVRNLLHIRHLSARLAAQNASLAAQIHERDDKDRQEEARRVEAEDRLDAVIASDALSMVFQPIIDLDDGALAGTEALARFASEPTRPPDVWFEEATSIGRGVELEMRAIELALGRLVDLPDGCFVSINASPSTISSPQLFEALLRHDATRVVVELTEHEEAEDYDTLLAAIAAFRHLGARLAVDDAGTGFAGLQQILRLGPDIIKLDRFLIVGIDGDPVRRSLTTAMVAFSEAIGARLLAEGIETAEELATLRSLGVSLGQGYHLGRPAPLDDSWSGSRLELPPRERFADHHVGARGRAVQRPLIGLPGGAQTAFAGGSQTLTHTG